MVFISPVLSEDLLLGDLTFAMGSTINDIECAAVQAIGDDTLESVEEFSIYVSDSLTMSEVFRDGVTPIGTFTVTTDAISLPLTLPCENASIIIDTSDTNGQSVINCENAWGGL